jgi:dTDP-glucose 4,6-dehydratase
MSWQGRTVLVTGAGGFIGSHLAERLVEEGASTRALVRYNAAGAWGWLDSSPQLKEMEVVLGDIRDADTLRHAVHKVDVVFHLAALIAIPYSYVAPLSYVRTNVEGTLNLLQACRDADVVRVVHTSTSEVYGTARYVPMDEGHPLEGQSPYAASKIGADMLAEAFHRSFGLPVSTIRPFNTFGPRQSARAVIPTIVTQALTQHEVRLGNVAPTRDLTFVADTVEGFLRVAENEATIGEVVNVGSGREISIADLAATILRLMNRDLPVVGDPVRVRPEASEVDRLLADVTRAREWFGWAPRHTLDDGLAQTIQWIARHIEHYRADVYAT